MSSVTQVIKRTKQPYGGYLKVSEFKKIQLNDNQILKEENIHSSLVGMAVDYLTRLMLGTSPEDAFKISLLGAQVIKQKRKALTMLEKVNGLDKESIYYACKLVGYDVCYRFGRLGYKPVSEIKPDDDTINNIRIMVERSLNFCLHSRFNRMNRNQLRLGSARQLLSELLCGFSSFLHKELDMVVSL